MTDRVPIVLKIENWPRKARAFTMKDAVSLGALAELARIGVAPGTAAEHMHGVYGFDDDDALLVMTQGPVEVVSGALTIHVSTNPIIMSEIVRSRDLAKVAADPAVRSMAVVNLSAVERRMIETASVG